MWPTPHPAAGAALSLHPSMCTARKGSLLFKNLLGGTENLGPDGCVWGGGSSLLLGCCLGFSGYLVQGSANWKCERRGKGKVGRGAQTGIFRRPLQGEFHGSVSPLVSSG